jgi:hypothetical protein
VRYALLSLLIAGTALAGIVDGEKVIVGKWEVSNPRRPSRIVFFHPNHTWGVTNFDPDKPEEINGRRWRTEGDKLILTYPTRNDGRDRLESYAYKIVSFSRDKFATDVFTYKRIK